MVSGRGLGITGGTLDKLESIPGFNVNMEIDQAIAQLRNISVVMMGQTDSFCPADRKLYALRDVTATVESQPLLVSSTPFGMVKCGRPYSFWTSPKK